MKLTPTIFLGSFGAAAATFALAQEAPTAMPNGTPSGEPLSMVRQEGASPLRPFAQPDEPQEGDTAGDEQLDIVARLTVDDIDAREAAFDEIARKAAIDPAVRGELRDLSDRSGDVDLAFTARLALREADRLSTWGRVGSGFGGRALKTPNDPFQSMRQQMESLFGSDPFVDEFFANDPFFSRPFGGRQGSLGVDPFGRGGDPFESMQKRVEEMRKQFDEMHSRASRRGSAAPQALAQSSSVSVQTTPKGVKVEITENDGSGPKVETYEAESMDALLELYPELKGRVR